METVRNERDTELARLQEQLDGVNEKLGVEVEEEKTSNGRQKRGRGRGRPKRPQRQIGGRPDDVGKGEWKKITKLDFSPTSLGQYVLQALDNAGEALHTNTIGSAVLEMGHESSSKDFHQSVATTINGLKKAGNVTSGNDRGTYKITAAGRKFLESAKKEVGSGSGRGRGGTKVKSSASAGGGKVKSKRLQDYIVAAVHEASGNAITVSEIGNAVVSLGYRTNASPDSIKRTFMQQIGRLKESGLVKTVEKDGRTTITLTAEGKKQAKEVLAA